MTPTLETSRLILRPLELADAEQAQALFPEWEIVRYLRKIVPWPYPMDGCYKYYRDIALPAVERGHEWAWTLRLKGNPDQLIGAISVFRHETDNRGFWLGLPWQRQGFMSEACDAVTDFWFDVLKFPVLRVPKAIANTGSRRISEKQGLRVIAREDRDYVSGRLPSEIWEITAEEWRVRRQQSQ
ncbi:MAG TPA: GNAT family N-acetyltransferase [Candidatus Dormibacteraeota bacterium]|nr:GNAT family N-acetyltransferase [Candidatus Dormibacteraeota bacterium]